MTITGSGFGAAQGGGQVWLGTAPGVVQTWSDTQVVALVGAGSASGKAQLLQNGVLSNAIQFNVNTLQVSGVSPASGLPGTSVTFTGTGFGLSQGSRVVWLGSAAGWVVSWSDTEVVATVAPAARTGIARIQKDGVSSNALTFTVLGGGGDAVTVVPNLITMLVGDTHKIQALDAAGHSVTGLTWISIDSAVVSLSSEDPPVLSAVAPGRTTITAGNASAEVTVTLGDPGAPGTLPLGTVLWSVPGNVTKIVPAVPSPSGVADVFAFLEDGTVQAITSDGTVAWTANVDPSFAVADFQGGLVFGDLNSDDTYSIVKLDGITGQRVFSYAPEPPAWVYPRTVVHTDGTIIGTQDNGPGEPWHSFAVIGLDPATGAQKSSVEILSEGQALSGSDGPIVAGDGYVYVAYAYTEVDSELPIRRLWLLRMDSSGAFERIHIYDYDGPLMWQLDWYDLNVHMITNADQGVLLTWSDDQPHAAIVAGTSVSMINAPASGVTPVLQAQDGSFVGEKYEYLVDGYSWVTVAFDANGNVRWTVPGYQPQIATADGGVIATANDDMSAVTFDQNGNVTGQIPDLPIYSWTGNWYRYGSIRNVAGFWYYLGASLWALAGGQYTIGTGGIPIDSDANKKANEILSPAMWRKFAKSHCAAVFKDPRGIPAMRYYYDASLQLIQQKQHRTNFYDVSNPEIGDLKVRVVTGGEYWKGNDQILRDYLVNAHAVAATANMGEPKRTAIVLRQGVLSSPRPKFILVHEVLFHAYYGLGDNEPYGNAFFLSNGLWRENGSNVAATLSPWMSTDCTCTPSNPATQGTCNENTANW